MLKRWAQFQEKKKEGKQHIQRTQRPVITKYIFKMVICLMWLCPKKEQRNQRERGCNDKFHHNSSYSFSQICWVICSSMATFAPGLHKGTTQFLRI